MKEEKQAQRTIRVERELCGTEKFFLMLAALFIVFPSNEIIKEYISSVGAIEVFLASFAVRMAAFVVIINILAKFRARAIWNQLADGIIDWKKTPVKGTAQFSCMITVTVKDAKLTQIEKGLSSVAIKEYLDIPFEPVEAGK